MRFKKSPATESLIKLLSREDNAQFEQYSRLIKGSLEKGLNSGECFGPVVPIGKSENGFLLLKGKGSYLKFRKGDRIELRTLGQNSDSTLPTKLSWLILNVNFPKRGQIEITIKSDQTLIPNDLANEYFIFPTYSPVFTGIIKRRLYNLKNESHLKENKSEQISLNKGSTFKSIYDTLNPSQQSALDQIIDQNLNGTIQGPPGTGKTQLMRALFALAIDSDLKVGLTSYTHAGVDNLLSRSILSNDNLSYLRVGDASKIRSEFYDIDSKIGENHFNSFPKTLEDHNLIAATTHKWAMNSKAPKLDLLIVDEASQVPIFFWPIIETLAKRVVLVGDQFQLPPVLTSELLELPDSNVFSHCLDNETPMLEIQYRMNAKIQDWSSKRFYKGKLRPTENIINRDILSNKGDKFNHSLVRGIFHSFPSYLNSNTFEADSISANISELLKAGIPASEIGVISPLRMQAGAICASLQDNLGVDLASKILVDTVERFQGQEKEVIFLSLAISGSSPESLNFLSDPKRLNVAVTRAKSRFTCLANGGLSNLATKYKNEDLSSFLNWIEGNTISSQSSSKKSAV